MSSETISDRRSHLRSISVTAICALAGVAAGVASYAEVGATVSDAGDSIGLAIALVAILVVYFVVKFSGIYDDDEFGIKHYLFISFMVFSFWFITWGILLTEHYLA